MTVRNSCPPREWAKICVVFGAVLSTPGPVPAAPATGRGGGGTLGEFAVQSIWYMEAQIIKVAVILQYY
jgi:hypothetical protein